jgi:hypothetical protein
VPPVSEEVGFNYPSSGNLPMPFGSAKLCAGKCVRLLFQRRMRWWRVRSVSETNSNATVFPLQLTACRMNLVLDVGEPLILGIPTVIQFVHPTLRNSNISVRSRVRSDGGLMPAQNQFQRTPAAYSRGSKRSVFTDAIWSSHRFKSGACIRKNFEGSDFFETNANVIFPRRTWDYFRFFVMWILTSIRCGSH